MKKIVFCIGILAAIGLGARYEFDLESGSAFVGYSDIQIPKSTGTRVSFSDELKSDPAWFIRGRFTCYFNARNSLSALVAPLEFRGSGRVNREVVFEGVAFPANATLSTVYKFNSYRLSYQHYWPVGEDLRLGLGATAKIREAAISITDSVRSSKKTNIGFVPIVRFSLWWRFARPVALLLEGDALAAPQGRAEDVSVALLGSITRGLSFKAGYRVLEGGSNVEPVYSFTWVNYLLAGLVASF